MTLAKIESGVYCVSVISREPGNKTSQKEAQSIQIMSQFWFRAVHTTHQFLKTAFWNLPPPLRRALNDTRYTTVRRLRKARLADSSVAAGNQTEDGWLEFKQNVLSHRNEYKGIFIQEVNIDWNAPLFQRPQHMATALARLGYLVIYRTVNWSDDMVNGFHEVLENVWLTNRAEVDTIEGAVRSIYSTAYAISPKKYAKHDNNSITIYEYIDHIDPAISGDVENVRRLNELKAFALKGGADVIVASAKVLFEEMQALNLPQNLLLVPNGVDTQHYRSQRHEEYRLPQEYAQFTSRYDNVVGYFGAIAPWLDYELLEEVVRQKNDVGFVFIGPDYYGGLDKLPSADNFLYVEPVAYETLPAYAQCFDVCIIPFSPGEIAQSTSPLKLFEYFALEKPVVVTSDMLECTAYEEVLSAGSADGVVAAIDKAIAIKDDPVFKAKLRKLADNNSWLERARQFEGVFSLIDSGKKLDNVV